MVWITQLTVQFEACLCGHATTQYSELRGGGDFNAFLIFTFRLAISIPVPELVYTMFVPIPLGFPWENGNSHFRRRPQLTT